MEEHNKEEINNEGEDTRMSNFSMVMVVIFVTVVFVFLFIKILFF